MYEKQRFLDGWNISNYFVQEIEKNNNCIEFVIM